MPLYFLMSLTSFIVHIEGIMNLILSSSNILLPDECESEFIQVV